ncbi:shikimate dehydrogenase, partial [Escherichia coli]|nr:shikimate dehydrogenase [Escherichia coli]
EDRGGIRQSIGAINTVVRAEDGALVGTNTDAGGFYAPIAGLDLDGKHAVVIGAGGAARAILFALSKVGIGRVTLLNRN